MTRLRRLRPGPVFAASLLQLTSAWTAAAQEPSAQHQVHLSAEEMLDLSSEAVHRGDLETAQAVLRSLQADPVPKVRNEARFRLAQIALARDDPTQAAVLLRAILDDEPGAQRVRLELARVLGMLGDISGARRELRQAQAGPLPADVARLVDRFSAALREYKRFGGQLELALAPDSNINRATASDTLGTVIGEFELDEDAQAQSGLGLAVRGTGYWRQSLGESLALLSQASLDTNLFGESRFNDVSARVAVGPEWQLSNGRLRVLVNRQRRWFGANRFSDSTSLGIDVERTLSKTAQLRLAGDLSRLEVVPNPGQDATSLFVSASIEKALTPRSGIGGSLAGSRQVARDAPYSAWWAQAGGFAWHELGETTLIASATFSRFTADARLPLYTRKRQDHFARVTLGATLRTFTHFGFAPQVRLVWEGNASTVGVYDYSRLRGEIGIVRAF